MVRYVGSQKLSLFAHTATVVPHWNGRPPKPLVGWRSAVAIGLVYMLPLEPGIRNFANSLTRFREFAK